MKGLLKCTLCVMMALCIIGFFVQSGRSASTQKPSFPDVPRMSVKELRSILGREDVAILDVRPVEQYEQSDHKIKGAVHEDPTKVNDWFHKYSKDGILIVTY